MSTLADYRAMIPAHASVPDATVSIWLTLAAKNLSATAFGTVWAEACIFYAASGLDALVQTGQAGALTGGVCDPPVVTKGNSAKADPDNVYWQRFLYLRDTRAAGAPGHIGPSVTGCPASWPFVVS